MHSSQIFRGPLVIGLVAAYFGLCLTACAPTKAPNTPNSSFVGSNRDAPLGFDPWAPEDYQYRLGSGDEVSVRFLLVPELNTNVTLSPDGSGVFPLVGSQYLAGASPLEAKTHLEYVYKSVLRTPQIDLLISGYGSSQIFVGGEVREAGAKNIKGELTIAQAIILAGGYLETARTQQIVVLRQGPNDPRPRLRVVDLRAALKGADAAMRVRPGDVIFVPKSRIAEVNQFLRQYVTNLIPFGISYNIGTLR